MEIITNKKYEVNKSQKILSLGFSKYGAEIDKGYLLIQAASHDTSLSNLKIKIANIREISYKKIKIKIQNNEKDYYGYEITYFYQKYRKPKTALCIVSELSASSWKELLNDLAQINPEIMVSDEVDIFLQEEEIQESNPWKIDFEQYNNIPNFNRDAFVYQRFTYLQAIKPLLFALVILSIVFYSIFTVFTNIPKFQDEEYRVYKLILLLLGVITIDVAIVVLFNKIMSFKKEKYLATILFFMLGIILTTLSLYKNWIG